MSRSTTTRWGALVAATTLTVGLAACGSEAEVSEPGQADPPEQSAEAPDDAQGSAAPDVAPEQVAEGEEVPVADLVERLKSPGEEQLSSFEMTLDMAGQGEELTMEGAVDIAGESPEMDIAMEVPGMGALSMILVDGGVYLAVPGLTGEGEYVEVPVSELESFGAEDLTSSLDLDSTWDGWEAGATSATFVGVEDVDGEQLEHFEIVVDTAAATEAMGQDTSAMPTEGMPAELTYDLWVDSEDLMRQMSFNIEGQTVQMSIDNWGGDVEITAPDESQLVELPGFTG